MLENSTHRTKQSSWKGVLSVLHVYSMRQGIPRLRYVSFGMSTPARAFRESNIVAFPKNAGLRDLARKRVPLISDKQMKCKIMAPKKKRCRALALTAHVQLAPGDNDPFIN